jgi:hypothetical protein
MFIFEQWGHDVEYLRLFLRKKKYIGDWESMLDDLEKHQYLHAYDTPLHLDKCEAIKPTIPDLHKSRVREDSGPTIDILKELES